MVGSSGVVSGATSPVAFSGTIVPTTISGSYRFGLLLVTVAMILVPLLYLLLIAAVAWFLVWHLTTNTWILSGSGNTQWRFLGYLTPGVVGATLLFFMVKPILARRQYRGEPVQVSDAEQPALHALIREICRQVRAPLPSRVLVDCRVNASASLRGGVFGVFRRDVDLTIGLPLVTGLSVRELSGVLAHEFGHFAQGGGMRMTMLIRVVNAWLYRVVHERDSWDSTLEEWSKGGDWRVMLPMALARLSIWVSRQALAGVTLAGHGVSCYMLRQMEFDADSYEIKIAGTSAFTRTMVRLRELSAGSHLAYSGLRDSFENRAIPADLPLLFAEYSRRLPIKIREQVARVSDARTGTFDTHPSDSDRIAAAQAMSASGALLGGYEPATTLFREFDRLSADVTRHHYESELGLELDGVRLIAIDEALRGVEDQERTEAAVRAFFAGRVSVTRPLRIPVEEVATTDGAGVAKAFKDSRAAVSRSSVSEESYRQFEQYQVRRDLAFSAEQLFLAGLQTVDAERFSLAEPTLAGAQSAQARALEEQDTLRAELDPLDKMFARRLALGAIILGRHELADDARALAVAVNTLAEAVQYSMDARRFAMAMAFLEEATPALESFPHLSERTGSLGRAIENCRRRGFEVFRQAPIPTGELGVNWQRLLWAAPQMGHTDVLQRFLELYWACLSRLVRQVSDAEASNTH